jgi:hypothetical protein
MRCRNLAFGNEKTLDLDAKPHLFGAISPTCAPTAGTGLPAAVASAEAPNFHLPRNTLCGCGRRSTAALCSPFSFSAFCVCPGAHCALHCAAYCTTDLWHHCTPAGLSLARPSAESTAVSAPGRYWCLWLCTTSHDPTNPPRPSVRPPKSVLPPQQHAVHTATCTTALWVWHHCTTSHSPCLAPFCTLPLPPPRVNLSYRASHCGRRFSSPPRASYLSPGPTPGPRAQVPHP